MTIHATCTFEITDWEPLQYEDEGGVKLTRTRVVKVFRGDLEGRSTAELLMAGALSGSAVYVGLERIVGSLHGTSGSFVLIHNASMSSDGQTLSLTIMRDSGTGDLEGIGGLGNIVIDANGKHTLDLDFDLA
jgi:hypothetical protein